MKSKIIRFIISLVIVSIGLVLFQNATTTSEKNDDKIQETGLYSAKGNGHSPTWDGRLIIYTDGNAEWSAVVFKPEEFKKIQEGRSSELKVSKSMKVLKRKISDGKHYAEDSQGRQINFWNMNALSLAPASGNPAHDNPYRSDENGNYSDKATNYETYHLYIYTQLYSGIDHVYVPSNSHAIIGEPDKWTGEKRKIVENEFVTKLLEGTKASGKRIRGDILGRLEIKVVIKNPKTAEAEPIKSILAEQKDFEPLIKYKSESDCTDKNSKSKVNCYIYGIEPSLTADGQLLVFNGLTAERHQGSIMYTYNSSASSTTEWSAEKPISAMYLDSNINKKYPLAFNQIKSNLGENYKDTEHVIGAYPWISWEGSEISFMSLWAHTNFGQARRAGFSIVGRWTGNKIRHIDGSFNKKDTVGRGTTLQTTDGKEFQTGDIRLFTSALASTSSIWNPFNNLSNPGFPNLFENPSMLFIHSNREEFSEIGFRDYVDGRYVLSLPMNPAINKLTYNSRINYDKKNEVDYFKTPDLSQNDLNGDLVGGASFSVKYETVPLPQNNSYQVLDTYETIGFRGQAIKLTESGAVVVKSAPILAESDFGLSVEFFVKPTAQLSEYQFLINKPTSYNVILESDNRVSFRVIIEKKPYGILFKGDPLQINKWSHIAFTHDPKSGQFKAYINGVLVGVESTPISKKISNDDNYALIIGPGGQKTVGKKVLMIMDEVKVSNVARSQAEIQDSAGLPYNSRRQQKLLTAIKTKFKNEKIKYPDELIFNAQVAQLGAKLFNDIRLSKTGTISCSSCHSLSESLATGDGKDRSIGVTNKRLSRHTPVVFNRIFSNSQMWDGRFNSLLNQASGPILHVDEMGLSNMEEAVDIVKNIPGYIREFKTIFGNDPTALNIQSALAAFQASLIAIPEQIDEAEINNGRELFFGKARCAACHNGLTFSDEQFHNTGIFENENIDLGRKAITLRDGDFGKFKTPTLINISKTSPYMHDGSINTLDAVVRRYIIAGATESKNKDPEIKIISLNEGEISDLVKYLESLDSNVNSIFNFNILQQPPVSCKSNESGRSGVCMVVNCKEDEKLKNGQCVFDQELSNLFKVKQLYLKLLNRGIDPNGLNYFTNKLKNGTTIEEVELAIKNSPEYLIKQLYLKLLNRNADVSGLTHYSDRMMNGASIKEIEANMRQSTEYLCHSSGGRLSNNVCSCPSDTQLIKRACVKR